jgi:hypothetical protein
MTQSKHRHIHQCVCPTCQQHPHSQIAQQHRAINRVLVTLNEKNRRHFVGLLAIEWGARKIARLAQITGLSRTTIHRGKREVAYPGRKGKPHIREAGAGRIPVKKNNPVFLRQSTNCSKTPPRAIRSAV